MTSKSVSSDSITHGGIMIGGKMYDVRNTVEDNQRRCAYFKNRSVNKDLFESCKEENPSAVLLEDERRLLDDLTISPDFEENHAYDLYQFFKSIHQCQTTAALSLNAGCDSAHYVLFSILFEAERKAKEEFAKLKKQPVFSADFREFSSKLIASAKGLIRPTAGVTPETRESALMKAVKPDLIDPDRNKDILSIFTIE